MSFSSPGRDLLVLGIDPGLTVTGFGLVASSGATTFRLIDHGTIRPKRALAMSERLLGLYGPLRELIARYQPAAVAIEEPFLGENIRSALALGRAQAMAMLAAAEAEVGVFTYSPNAVKSAVVGYGHGDKRQVAEMVRMQLGLKATPEPADAADALAVALCHAVHASRQVVLEGIR